MAPLVRRSIRSSILRKFLIVAACFPVCVPTPLALAQHPSNRTTGGVVHIPPPPILHAPLVHAPISAPRISVSPSAGALGTAGFHPPRRPIRPFPPALIVYESPFLLGGPFWAGNSCWWAACDRFWSSTLGYTIVSSPNPANYVSQPYESPAYVYGEERPDLPQLFLKDGTILNVIDYWLVDDHLHFTMSEENGTKPAEHVIPFDALDLQTTVDVNTRRGFRFMLRNEPFEQYLRDHPEGTEPVVTRPRQ